MRKNTKKVDIIIITVIILLIADVILLAVMSQSKKPENGELALSDFNGKQAGIITGSVHVQIIGRLFPGSGISVWS